MAVQVQTVTVHSQCASVRYGQIYTFQSHTFLPPVHNEHGSIVHYCTGPPLCPASPQTVRDTRTHISAKLVALASWSFHLLFGFKEVLVTLKMVTILSHIHTPRPPWTFRQRTFLSGDYFCVLLHKVCSLYFGLAPALSHYQHSGYYDNLIISDSAASFLFCLPLSKFWSG